MTYRLGLTGSIGMGKSTTARMFVEEGCALWDADAAVHRLYATGGDAVAEIAKIWPAAIVDNAVSRDRLKDIIAREPDALRRIETIVHPLVRKSRETFLATTTADIAVFDIPLLFETRAEGEFDAVACVTVDAGTQKSRVLERGTMTEAQFDQILSKQMPIAEKLQRADFVIETDTLEHAMQQVKTIVTRIREHLSNA